MVPEEGRPQVVLEIAHRLRVEQALVLLLERRAFGGLWRVGGEWAVGDLAGGVPGDHGEPDGRLRYAPRFEEVLRCLPDGGGA